MPSDFGLTVRRHERHALSLASTIVVASHPQPRIGDAEFSGGALKFSAESGVGDHGAAATVVDLGAGGIGALTKVFYPRGAILRVRVLDDRGSASTPDLDVLVRVQRIAMVDRAPTYLLGTSFVDPGPSLAESVQRVVSKAVPSPASRIGGGAA